MAKAADRHSRHYRGEDACAFTLDASDYGKLGPSEGFKNDMERRRVHTRPMYEQECIAKVRGAHIIPPCSDGPTVHEPWTRGRGGPKDDPANMVPMCAFHNTWVSQDAEGQRWAEANDLLIHAWEGPRWLAAGGVNAPADWRRNLAQPDAIRKDSDEWHTFLITHGEDGAPSTLHVDGELVAEAQGSATDGAALQSTEQPTRKRSRLL